MSLQSILAYQEVDTRLYKLEKELSGSEERKEYVKVKKFLEGAPERLEALEIKATAFQQETEKLLKKCEQLEATLADFANAEDLVRAGTDVAFYQKKAQALIEQIKKVKAEINALTTSVKETDVEYQKLKKQVIAMQKQAPEISEKYKVLKASKDGERKAIEKELVAIAKDIPPAFMEKYQTKRKEKIFPVVAQMQAGRCPFCGMEPPLAARSKLSEGIECDNCHHIIFE